MQMVCSTQLCLNSLSVNICLNVPGMSFIAYFFQQLALLEIVVFDCLLLFLTIFSFSLLM